MSAAVIEAMLLRWSDSHTGRTVTLLLPDDGDHPFKGLKCGPANGQRLAVSVALIADDETKQPMESAKPRPTPDTAPTTTGGAHHRKPFTSLPLPQQAALLCNDMVFRAFCNEELNAEVSTEDEAATFMRDRYQVQSRSDLGKGLGDDQLFVADREQYMAWKLVGA